MSIVIESNIKNYEVFFKNNFTFFDKLIEIENSVFIVDKNIFELYPNLFKNISEENIFVFEAIEQNKTLEYVGNIYDFLIDKKAKRNTTIISIGGGITQDVTGFVASTLYRGVKWIFLPTTFLAITDSCIGSKTSINYSKYKNLIGTFYPPNSIYINVDFLQTLPELDFYSGVGETIKFQLMKEEYPKDFNKVIAIVEKLKSNKKTRLEIIKENIDVKLGYMRGDEFDLGRRNLLNYGHCFGHALETSSGYYVPHGIAVTVGIIFANILANKRGIISSQINDQLIKKLLVPNIPLKMRKKDFDREILLSSMKNDKKRIGKYLTVIIPNGDFSMVKVDDVTDEEFNSVLTVLEGVCFE